MKTTAISGNDDSDISPVTHGENSTFDTAVQNVPTALLSSIEPKSPEVPRNDDCIPQSVNYLFDTPKSLLPRSSSSHFTAQPPLVKAKLLESYKDRKLVLVAPVPMLPLPVSRHAQNSGVPRSVTPGLDSGV